MKKTKSVPESIKSVISKAGDGYKLEIFFPKQVSPSITYHPEFQEIYEIALPYSEKSDIQVNCEKPNKHDALLESIPKEFRSALAYMAYESGHSAGEQEVLIVLSNLIDGIKPSIEAFAKNHNISL